jgi:hypothetical protein
MRRLAGGAGRRVGSEIRPQKPFGAETGQRVRDRLVERREAQPPTSLGARVPGQASQTCLVRRAERALARPVRGLASPWRLPALHCPSREGTEKGEAAYPRRENKEQGQRSVDLLHFLVGTETRSGGLCA